MFITKGELIETIEALRQDVRELEAKVAGLEVSCRHSRDAAERLERDMQELMTHLGLKWEQPTGKRIVKISERLKQDDVRFSEGK